MNTSTRKIRKHGLATRLAESHFITTAENFDVVIAAGADFAGATANGQFTFDRPQRPQCKRRDGGSGDCLTTDDRPLFRQFVAVPWLGYDSTHNRLVDPLRSLTLSDDCTAGDRETRHFSVDGNYTDPFLYPEPVEAKSLESVYDDRAVKDYLAPNRYLRPEQPFQIAVLAILRKYAHADIAMLEKRDIYWGPFPDTLQSSIDAQGNLVALQFNGELLDRILWRGGYVQVLTVKGDTLKKVLEASDKQDAPDQQATLEKVETGRGLVVLGIEKTRDKDYLLVDGTRLDPDRLYTVATSNHLAVGDTGYPELADPQFNDPRLPSTGSEESPRIASLVCKELGGGDSCVESPGQGKNASDLPQLSFAEIRRVPSQLAPGLGTRAWTWFWRDNIRFPELLTDATSLLEHRRQLGPSWRLSLKDMSLNLSGVRDNLSEIQRSETLAGVTEPGAGSAKGHALDYSVHAEWVRSAKRFVRGLTVYKATVTANTPTLTLLPGQTVPPTVEALPVVSRSKNQGAVDAGLFLHSLFSLGSVGRGAHKYDSRFGVVIEPLHFDSPLHRTELPINAFYSHTTDGLINPAFTLKLNRNRRSLGRLALRLENSKSYLEAGIERGKEWNAVQEIISNKGPCLALATGTLNSCLKGLQQITGFDHNSLHPLYRGRENNGAYVSLDWSAPKLWHRFSFRTEDYGEYSRPAHLDSPIDTLYRNDVKESVKFAFISFPNLSFGPALERFDYENKVERIHFRSYGPVFNLTYSFDRYPSGGPWKTSLGYSPSANSAAAK